ncbi:4Fe-4S binding protein [Aegicerativicinus sediminis]|uniref:4Fe-4S binding protein n=1 Tax=Aegicerativicinus sediminis TaxID=2893202 RepID=UPI001E5AB884|nr:4Fe-4S binding protein [Aegicerativicinus sediminis]
MTPSKILVNANQATARMAYRLNEIALIYPITPASEMAELTEQWSSEGVENLFGDVPVAFQMQGEGGVAGAMHGALQTGSLTTTFTASQGLLLMLPNLYKIAGQLLPNVIHVATRSIATHSLSVFGDHSDIMAVRQCGYAILGGNNPQEAYDFALLSQVASLRSRIPFIHFFDGFRTSHELNIVEIIDDSIIKKLMPEDLIYQNFDRRLSPHNPSIRGTAQGPETFFESSERSNSVFNNGPSIMASVMEQFEKLTGRIYKPFQYIGPDNPKHVIIAMGSACDTIECTLDQFNRTKDTGLIKVRLYRPFATELLIKELPKTCKTITVLDRTKENGSTGEPLYLDVFQSVKDNFFNKDIKVFGGRYGLSSKEFTPEMVLAIIENARSMSPKNKFTIGITDNISNLSLGYKHIDTKKNDNLLEIIIEDTDKKLTKNIQAVLLNSRIKKHIQSYTGCSYNKDKVINQTHIRFSNSAIRSPFLISKADVTIFDSISSLQSKSSLETIKSGGIILVFSELCENINMNFSTLQYIVDNNIEVYYINSEENGERILKELFIELQSNHRNIPNFIDQNYRRITFKPSKIKSMNTNIFDKNASIKVSGLPIDGTFETFSDRALKAKTAEFIPQWNTLNCVECGLCSLVCPQGALRMKLVPEENVSELPSFFPLKKLEDSELSKSTAHFSIQVNPDQCTSCNFCVEQCPTEALEAVNTDLVYNRANQNWKLFKGLPEANRSLLNNLNLFQQQFMEPLFRSPQSEKRCTESQYIKLLTQLFGDRLLIANATGSSSIFGGSITSLPFYTNSNGEGPAWANSLFEDNAEFGFGFHLTQKFQLNKAKRLLLEMMDFLPDGLVATLLLTEQNSELDKQKVKLAVRELKSILGKLNSYKAKALISLADEFINKEIWIVGGDGWAYDIGFGGIDHVVASGENVNILILDNEGYSNTGGQASKATPEGKRVKFAYSGKTQPKKDLGAMLATYPNTQILNVSLFENPSKCLEALVMASNHNGPTIILADCIDRKKTNVKVYNENAHQMLASNNH